MNTKYLNTNQTIAVTEYFGALRWDWDLSHNGTMYVFTYEDSRAYELAAFLSLLDIDYVIEEYLVNKETIVITRDEGGESGSTALLDFANQLIKESNDLRASK